MNDFISSVKTEIEKAKNTPLNKYLRTGDIRKISSRFFKEMRGELKEDIFSVCDELLKQRNWPMGIIAFDFAYRMRKQYDETTFTVFENWLEQYVRGWCDCDDFCTHAFGELIRQNTALSKKTVLWTKRDEFWMRRAAAVVLIPSIWHDKYSEINPLQVADILMQDEHDLVRKGYGWMLKILSVKEPELVFDYLLKNKATMPRVSYRYALEKMSAEKRKILMR
ncbi:MAG TPA: DNA alkylation repair protein [Oscillospiraceae bacterium]|nr:DNA alkylation repair protein [Oscillospiraceae bacterium]HPF56540.1 DNA alkylation repair protein [Clostridiales bacterium]HPK35578.1 DNA alkylation repair protein [Oscillospiraceae bacterium]HPR75885.1 DNA alkylation repair protein [Oscillospiraceae bacterium]